MVCVSMYVGWVGGASRVTYLYALKKKGSSSTSASSSPSN
jgi:hypothetical protein